MGLAAKDGPYTVKDCLEDYVGYLNRHKKSALDSAYRINANIVEALGDVDCARLTNRQIEDWLRLSPAGEAARHHPGLGCELAPTRNITIGGPSQGSEDSIDGSQPQQSHSR